jgi:flagellar basal body rod protein FlgC
MQDSARRIANASATAPTDTGTRAADSTASPGTGPAFQPDARFSASYGLLSGPDVNLAGEIIEQLMAGTSFIAVAQVIRADAKMIQSLLDIKV